MDDLSTIINSRTKQVPHFPTSAWKFPPKPKIPQTFPNFHSPYKYLFHQNTNLNIKLSITHIYIQRWIIKNPQQAFVSTQLKKNSSPSTSSTSSNPSAKAAFAASFPTSTFTAQSHGISQVLPALQLIPPKLCNEL